MLAPIAFIPGPARRFRKRRSGAAAPLALLAATYQTAASVMLEFNEMIDISGIAINSLQLTDGPGGHIYIGVAATAVDPFTVRITLQQVTSDTGPNVTLEFEAPTGIVAAGSGQEWEGVSGLELPYP